MHIIMILILVGQIQRGDLLFKNMNYEGAMQAYTQALNSGKRGVYYRLSRLLCNMGDAESDKNIKKSYYMKALYYANMAISEDSLGYEGFLWKAASLGDIALFKGGKQKIKYAFEIKRNVLTAISLNKNCALCFFILGEYNREAATLNPILKSFAKALFGKIPEGTLDSSYIYDSIAVNLDSASIQFHLGLARTLIKLKDTKDAAVHLRKAISLPVFYKKDYNLKEEAKKLLKKTG